MGEFAGLIFAGLILLSFVIWVHFYTKPKRPSLEDQWYERYTLIDQLREEERIRRHDEYYYGEDYPMRRMGHYR